MSTSYFIFTEVLANDQWHCINPQVMKLLPIEHLILVPTLRSDSRYQFEKAYRQLECDGHPFTVDEMSRNLQASVNDWLTPEDSVRIAVCYDDILKLLNTSGKEHSAFDSWDFFIWGSFSDLETLLQKLAAKENDKCISKDLLETLIFMIRNQVQIFQQTIPYSVADRSSEMPIRIIICEL